MQLAKKRKSDDIKELLNLSKQRKVNSVPEGKGQVENTADNMDDPKSPDHQGIYSIISYITEFWLDLLFFSFFDNSLSKNCGNSFKLIFLTFLTEFFSVYFYTIFLIFH